MGTQNTAVKVQLGELSLHDVDKSGPTNCEEFIYVDIGSVDRETKKIVDAKYLPVAEAPSRAKQILRTGDVIVSMTRPNLNAVAKVTAALDGAIGSTGFHVIRSEYIEPGLAYYLVQTREFVEAMCKCVQGALYPAVRPSDISSFEFLLPPIAEQQRIVAKIEELFSELDKGVENLHTAQQQLKVYRQALLKHAFEGKLTADWRTQNPDKLESADALLARIRQEREARYQQQLQDWQSKSPSIPLLQRGMTRAPASAATIPPFEKGGLGGISRNASKPKAPKTLPPLTGEELADLPELPHGWIYVKAEAICDFITKGTTPSKELLFDEKGEVPFIKVYNLTKTGALDFTISPTFVSQKTHNGFLGRSKVHPGDVLMNIVGPPLGKVSIVPDHHPEWNINQAIAIFRTSLLKSNVLAAFLASETTVRKTMRKSKATAGQFNLTLEICREIVVPVCSISEQIQLAQELEEKSSILDQLEQTITHSLQQAEALRQSILKKAFSGQLVAQDPNDEPASVLLERIRAERAAQPKARGRKARVSA